MINIHKKTLEDLEFNQVVVLVKEHCVTILGKEKTSEIGPFTSKYLMELSLSLVHEYVASFSNENRFPNTLRLL